MSNFTLDMSYFYFLSIVQLKHPIIGPLIKKQTDLNIYLISDLHLNHNKEFLYKKRGFDSCERYTNFCLNQLAELAFNHWGKSEEAYLISLGDNCFNDSEGNILDRFVSLPFTKIYSLSGNHCSGFNKVFSSTDNCYYKNLTLLSSNIRFNISKKLYIWLSHFPILDWDTNGFGVICGHCHGQMKELNEDNFKFGPIFDCGVDNALRLHNRIYFTLDECINILKHKATNSNSCQLHQQKNGLGYY